MTRTCAFLLLTLLLMSLCPLAASADTTPLTGEAVTTYADLGEPALVMGKVIDWVNSPGLWSDFTLSAEAEPLEVIYPHIFDCDCAILRCGGTVYMIDCATVEEVPRVIRCLELYGIRRIDTLFITHSHHDHIGGMRRLMDAVEVGQVMICFSETENDHIINGMRYAANHLVPVFHYGDGDVFTLGEARLEVFCKADASWGANDRSAVMRLSYGDCTMLFTGDIEKYGCARLLEAVDPELLKCDILKYPHHGKSRMTNAFYDTLQPELLVITSTSKATDGKTDVRYRHWPYALTSLGILQCTSDGQHWLCQRAFEDQNTKEPTGIFAGDPLPATTFAPDATIAPLVGLMATATPTAAPATATPQPAASPAEETAAPTAEPVTVIDRINHPEEAADFAFPADAELLEVLFPQMFDCDAALLRCGGETVLIDCCTDSLVVRLIRLCELYDVTRIDTLLITHAHHDHLDGLSKLAAAVDIGEMRICFAPDENDNAKRGMRAAEKAGIPVTTYGDGDVLTIGGATLQVWQQGDAAWGANDRSAAMVLRYGQRTMLFTGDLEAKGLQRLVDTLPAEQLRADILKVPHHGNSRLSAAFWAAVAPKLSIVTSNARETPGKTQLKADGHPYALTVPGIVYLRTDGTTWLAERTHTEDAAPFNY